jgi:hypothetical protein
VFEHVVVEFIFCCVGAMLFEAASRAMWRKCGKEVMGKVRAWRGRLTCNLCDFWEEMVVATEDKEVVVGR